MPTYVSTTFSQPVPFRVVPKNLRRVWGLPFKFMYFFQSWSLYLPKHRISRQREHVVLRFKSCGNPWECSRLQIRLNPLSANPIKQLNTLKQFVGNLPTNCLSVFDHFMGLMLKGLMHSTCSHSSKSTHHYNQQQ